MSTGIYGFYKSGVFKVASYSRESHPKSLGYSLFKTLYYAWPEEIALMFSILKVVKANQKPTESECTSILESFGSPGYNFKKPKEEITFNDLLEERQNDIMSFFVAIRHAGLRHMVDGIENIKTWGICDWVYIYNLDVNRIEIYHIKKEMPISNVISDDPMVYLNEGYDLIHTMDHNPNDLGRNQFDLSGLDYAYNKVFNS